MSETSSKRNFSLLEKFVLLGLAMLIAIATIWVFLHFTFQRRGICNILLISIDTCRADYLSCYGCPRQTTPNIDAVAQEGILFTNTFTPVPLTLPGHSSMLTGTTPLYHKVHANIGYCLAGFNLTLAEILRKHQYKTAAIIGEFVLNSQLGLAQGFDTYNDQFLGKREPGFEHERRAKEVSQLAEKWLDEHIATDENFFLFLHYFDPHYEYIPPEPFASTYADDPYAGEIAYTDHCIGSIMNKLKQLKLYDSTLIIITSDHGECFGEHGEYKHGYFIYNPAIKVPLIFKPPGKNAPKKIKDIAGLIDIVPTVLGYIHVPVPPQVQGKDLSSCFAEDTGKKEEERYFYCESLFPTVLGCNPLRGIIGSQWKYVQTTRPELYDLIADPQEENNLIKKEIKQAYLLENHLKSILDNYAQQIKNDSKIQMDEEALNRLRGLGYLGGSISESYELDKDKDDPKDFVTLYNKIVDMLSLRDRKQNEQAKILCEQILQQRPGLGIIHSVLGFMLKEEGSQQQAISHFREALNDKYGGKAENVVFLCSLADALTEQGQLSEAVSFYNQALQIDPTSAATHYQMAIALEKQQKTDESIQHYSEAIKINPDYPEMHYRLANALLKQGKINEAIKHLRQVVILKPDYAVIRYYLATNLEKAGRIQEAVREYRNTLRLTPDHPEPANNLAWILATHKNRKFRNPAEAVRLAELACKNTDYKNPDFLNTLAAAYAAIGRNDEAQKTAQKALNLARSTGQEKLATKIQQYLNIYSQRN
jgi:arylsulfatase A-like enzyme/Flp pilus assembly protein TadD